MVGETPNEFVSVYDSNGLVLDELWKEKVASPSRHRLWILKFIRLHSQLQA